MHLLNARQLYSQYSADDELLWTEQKYASDFMSKLIPGVIQMKKPHKTTRNWEHDFIINIIFIKLMFNHNMRGSRCCASSLNCGYFNRKNCR